ncbi:MAG: pyridoxal phosphate-dependent aminotransferase [Candidatus Neomarinimicrobiota bacterium]
MLELAQRVQRVKPSFTLEMISRAAELRSQGIDIVNFGAGEPDFNTPVNIRHAAKRALDEGFTKYTAGAGMLELREAVCQKLKRENALEIEPSQVLISNGEKQSLYLACQALFQKGDKVLVFAPYWVSFPAFVTLADAEPVIINTAARNNFEPDFSDDKLIGPEIKGVIINSPSNPTGAIWSESTIVKILKLARKNNWTVIADECYERFIFNHEFKIAEKLNLDHGINARIITCMSLSKTYAMTGWRIGYSFGPSRVIKAMAKIQGQATSCANSIGQKAAVEALIGDQKEVEKNLKIFEQRRNLMVSLLNEIPGFSCATPDGAFYAFPDISSYLGKYAQGKLIKDSFDLSDYLLASANVVTIPGDGFGAPGFLRFSFTVNNKTMEKGIGRIKKVLKQLKNKGEI